MKFIVFVLHFFVLEKMSELQVEDWKLEAQAVVQLCRKKCDKSVSLSVFMGASN